MNHLEFAQGRLEPANLSNFDQVADEAIELAKTYCGPALSVYKYLEFKFNGATIRVFSDSTRKSLWEQYGAKVGKGA